jgi:hypothetical protein
LIIIFFSHRVFRPDTAMSERTIDPDAGSFERPTDPATTARTTEEEGPPLVPALTTTDRQTDGRPNTDEEIARLQRALGRGE